MYTFPKLIKNIRKQADLTQSEFASILGVSSVLIAMVETGQKEVSKNLLLKLADKMKVSPNSITPFLFDIKTGTQYTLSTLEKNFIKYGEKMQDYLIINKSKNLK